MRAGIAIGVVLALPLACGAFGRAEDTLTPDAGTSSGSTTMSPPSDGSVDAEPDAAPPVVCDDFQGNALDPAFWQPFDAADGDNKTPKVGGHLLSFPAESSSDSRLDTVRRSRSDTISYSATFTIRAPIPDFKSDNFPGSIRVFDADASLDVEPGEYSALEFDGDHWFLRWREYFDGSDTNHRTQGPPIRFDEKHTIAFVERFDAYAGYIHVSFDGASVAEFTVDNVANQRVARADWSLRVGAVHKDATPSVQIDFESLCVSP